MNRRDRKKQQKKKERQERLRQEKHVRQSQPRTEDEDELEDENLKTGQPAASGGGHPTSPGSPRPAETDSTADPERGPLDNFFKGEPARQWLDALLADTDMHPIVETLDPVSYVPEHLMLKASVCCEMLVAAEVLAAALGRPSRHLPLRVAAWLVERDALFSPAVVALAARAVRRVGEFSELRRLWDSLRLGEEWLRGVEDLHGRLQR